MLRGLDIVSSTRLHPSDFSNLCLANGSTVTLLEYVKLWVMADYFRIPRLQNEAMICLISSVGFRYNNHHETPIELATCVAKVIKYVYANSVEDGLLRKVCMDILLPEWQLGGRRPEVISVLYDLAFEPGMARDTAKSMSRIGDFTGYRKPSIERYLTGSIEEREYAKRRSERMPLRKRGVSEAEARED